MTLLASLKPVCCGSLAVLILTASGPALADQGNPSVAAMSHGDGTACAVMTDGSVKCWGANDHGQLGYGHTRTIGDDETPADVAAIKLGGAASQVQTNGAQTFVLMADGSVRAFGLNDSYQLGVRHTQDIGDDETLASASVSTTPVLGGTAVELSAGGYFACARLEEGSVRCWGPNDLGQLGYGHTQAIGDDEDPADAGDVALGTGAVQLATGAYHACALLDNGAVRCWGANGSGQLGLGHTQTIGDDETPAAASPVDLGGEVALAIAAGEDHTCARTSVGGVYCWGSGSHGQLGAGHGHNIGDDETPASAGEVPLPGLAVDLSVGKRHTCALLDTGLLYCWGDNRSGQLGVGDTADYGVTQTPIAVGPTASGSALVVELFDGAVADKTCGRFSTGELGCWGANTIGQLGLGDTNPRTAAGTGNTSGNIFVNLVDETIE